MRPPTDADAGAEPAAVTITAELPTTSFGPPRPPGAEPLVVVDFQQIPVVARAKDRPSTGPVLFIVDDDPAAPAATAPAPARVAPPPAVPAAQPRPAGDDGPLALDALADLPDPSARPQAAPLAPIDPFSPGAQTARIAVSFAGPVPVPVTIDPTIPVTRLRRDKLHVRVLRAAAGVLLLIATSSGLGEPTPVEQRPAPTEADPAEPATRAAADTPATPDY